MTSDYIKYIFTYEKKDGSVRDIKTNRDIEKSTPSHILVWDCENNGWRKLIKDKIQEGKKYESLFTYKKKDGNVRDIRADVHIRKQGIRHILVRDIEKEAWRTLIIDNIIDQYKVIRYINTEKDI